MAFAFLALLLSWAVPAHAQTLVSGNIASSVRWTTAGSPYVLSGPVTVQSAAVLTVDPGVVVYMAANAELRVESGKLLALGELARPIKITSEKVRNGAVPAAGDWGQLVLGSGASGSVLQYTELSYGRGVAVNGAAVTFANVGILNHAGAAVTADLAANLSGSGNQASGNTLNAVVVPAGDITGTARFGLRGIPYLLKSGQLSVGVSPSIDSVTPSSILAGETATISVTGKRLTGAAAPQWSVSGLTTQLLPGATDTAVQLQVAASLTAGASNADLTLLTDAGEVAKTAALIVQRNQPRITSVSPTSLYTLAGSSPLTLTGSFFASNSVVEADGQALATTYNSATQLSATLPEQSTAGSRSIRIRTPDAQNAGAYLTSNVVPLSVLQAKPSFDPVNASMIAGGFQAVALQLPFVAPAGGLEFNLTSSAPAIATVQPTVIVPAGSKTANVQVQGVSVGEAQIVVTRTGWVNATLPVAVIQPPVTLNYEPVTSALVGVVVGTATAPVTQSIDGLSSSLVGVTLGSFARQMTPSAGVVGTSVNLQISGEGLNSVSAVQFVPADGLTIGVPSVSADGKLLSVSVGIDAAAPKSLRHVVLSTAAGKVDFSSPTADRFIVAAPAPRVDSVNPNVLVAGQSSVKLTVRGENLRDVQGLRFEPAQGVAAISALSANTEGTQLELTVQVASDATSGPRTVVITTAGGESSSVSTAGNTLQVARQVGATYQDVTSPLVGVSIGQVAVPQIIDFGPVVSASVGVMVGTPSAAEGQSMDPVTSPLVGLVVGSAAFDMTPAAASVGTSVAVTVQGSGLSAVSGVQLLPADGITVSNVAVNAAGTQVSFNLAIDAAAAKTLRRVVLQTSDAANPVVPFMVSAKSQFLVTAPAPVVDISITPQVVVAGQSRIDLTVRGRNLRDLVGVRFDPPQGLVALGTPVANADGTSMVVSVQASADASTGPRTLIVVTAAGESSATATPANTVQVARQVSGPFNDVSSSLVGVVVGTVAAPESVDKTAYAQPVGVIVGPVVTGLSPAGGAKGGSGNLVMSGFALTGATTATLVPNAAASGVTLGAAVVNEAGTEATVPFSVAPTAPTASYRLGLVTASGSIATASDAPMQWRVLDAPTISSFEPIVMQVGRAYTLVVRGANLKEVQRVAIEPSAGITSEDVALAWSTDGLGEKLSVRVIVSPTATTGPRVLRLVYPGGMTSGQSATSNTLSVVSAP